MMFSMFASTRQNLETFFVPHTLTYHDPYWRPLLFPISALFIVLLLIHMRLRSPSASTAAITLRTVTHSSLAGLCRIWRVQWNRWSS